MGATPHKWAQAASERRRSGLSPAATSRAAAVSMPTPKISSMLGAVAVTSSSSSSSETGQACAVGAGAFHPYLGHLPEGAHPLEHRFIAPGGGVERLHTEDTADRIQGGSHVDIQVGVDSTDDGAASFFDGHGHPSCLLRL